ncbi:MAG TPA: Ig-like domain-containing protein [Thermoanaerobaculia bacterium]|nr:Ig-like domain-containing protein [Thermoanaerobaculia bacterium]
MAWRLAMPLLAAWGVASTLGAQAPRNLAPALAAKAVDRPELHARPRLTRPTDLPAQAAAAALVRLAVLGAPAERALIDPVSGNPATLVLAHPLIPGRGAGNRIAWSALGRAAPPPADELDDLAWSALRAWLAERGDALGVDPAELGAPRIAVHDGGALIQIVVPRRVAGMPVPDSALHAVINAGNLVLLGTSRWSPAAPGAPSLSRADARRVVLAHLEPLAVTRFLEAGRLELIATDPGPRTAVGRGYRYRLAWTLALEVAGDPGSWRATVDAASGELLSFVDTNRYESARKVTGGVLPLTNDGTIPLGVEQPGTPMPFADVATALGPRFTDGGGNLPVCVDGEISTQLDGRYASVLDLCGELLEPSVGDLDLGTSAGTNCSAPEGGSFGNTRSARSVYHHLNRMRQTGLGHLPGNGWLATQVPALTNFPSELLLGCNAFWDGSGVAFTTDTAGLCANPGELAGVVQHEWGHGLDDNDLDGEVSNPAEGIADVFAALQLGDSCIGRGFFLGVPCDTGDGDPCTTCDGVRDVDWAQRTSGTPHDIEFIGGSCPFPFGVTGGPCGRAIHCEGAVVSESAWDLVHRDLGAAPYGLDLATSREIAARAVYLGSGMVGDWYACTPADLEGTPASGDGCNVDGGYLNLLAADDDNGDLGDGTPHMEAIHAAFDRHGIACDLPAPVTSGCAGAPTVAPQVTASSADRAVALSWDAVPGAESYRILRSEGVFGCGAGAVEVGATGATAFLDEGLLNGLDVHYVVLPVGAAPSCLGPASACVTATPSAGANLTADPSSLEVTIAGGDLDGALDNCESATLSFEVSNLGVVPLTDLEILEVAVLFPASGVVLASSLPRAVAASLAPCASATASFDLTAGGLAFNDSLALEVSLGAAELGVPRKLRLTVDTTETDLEPVASRSFDFETDLDGWQVVQGTFARSGGGGGDGTDTFVASSSFAHEQCDQIRSPLLRLGPASTLSLWTWADIEPPFEEVEPFVFWFDRANVGVLDVAAGTRTPLVPDGGRLYNAEGSDGACVTESQPGWADAQTSWAQSTFSAAAVDGGRWGGRMVQLDVGYGTDAELAGEGFRFDQVTLTDFELVSPDAQPDVCAPNAPPDALDDARVLDHLGELMIDVLANDEDPDLDPLTIDSVGAPLLGAVELVSGGPGLDALSYRREDCATGIDTFDYTAADGRGGFDTASVTVDSSALAERSAPHLVLSSHTVSAEEGFEACLSLVAGDGFAVGAGGAATLWSGGVVTLTDGFSVAAGGSLAIRAGTPP